METASYVALSRMIAVQRQTEMTANNLANANTPGFKTSNLVFSDYLVNQKRTTEPASTRTIHFVQDRATYRDPSPGSLSRTGNTLDVAMTSDGFLAFDTPRGERYSRNGRLTLDPNGQLVGSDGYPVMSTANTPIVLAPTDSAITISTNGTVETENGEVGRLRVVRFENVRQLRAESQTLYSADQQPPIPAEGPQLVQGMVEEANVKSIIEMTELMSQLREFQFASQFVERENDRATQAIERLTRRRG